MDINLFEKIINEIKNKTKLISFHILGDPLYIDNLSEYLQICKEKNIKVDIVTNIVFRQYLHSRF